MIAVLIYRLGWALQGACFTIAKFLDPEALVHEQERRLEQNRSAD